MLLAFRKVTQIWSYFSVKGYVIFIENNLNSLSSSRVGKNWDELNKDDAQVVDEPERGRKCSTEDKVEHWKNYNIILSDNLTFF